MAYLRKLNNPYQEALLIEATATYYPGMIQIYIPKEPMVRGSLRLQTPLGKIYHEDQDEITTEKETSIERSLRRSAKRISDYVLCNHFDMFVTFTIKEDRQNIERSKQKVINWLKNQRKRNGKFSYIVVPEFHKDGKSLHFHALIGGFTGKIVRAVDPKTGKPLKQRGKDTYQIVGYTLGFTNVKLVGSESEDRSKIGAYLKKYITKDMPIFHGKQRYWASKGLELPLTEDNPQEWYKFVEPDWTYEFENGTLMRFNVGRNALIDIFMEFNS